MNHTQRLTAEILLSFLPFGMLSCPASVVCAQAEEAKAISNEAGKTAGEDGEEKLEEHTLPTVIVEADRYALPGGFSDASTCGGLLGSKTIMDSPFTVMNLSGLCKIA